MSPVTLGVVLCSQSQHLNMFFSMEPQGHNVLRQLGLRDSAPKTGQSLRRWAHTVSVHDGPRYCRSVASAQNTIINRAGSGTGDRGLSIPAAVRANEHDAASVRGRHHPERSVTWCDEQWPPAQQHLCEDLYF